MDGRREAWLFPPNLDARVRQTSFRGSCVDEDEEEDVGGVGKLADCSASKVGSGGSREPSPRGEVGAVGGAQVEDRSIVDMKWFLEREKSKRQNSEEGGLRKIGNQPVQSNCAVCQGAVCPIDQVEEWRHQTDSHSVLCQDCPHQIYHEEACQYQTIITSFGGAIRM